jgi:hypothetical protein
VGTKIKFTEKVSFLCRIHQEAQCAINFEINLKGKGFSRAEFSRLTCDGKVTRVSEREVVDGILNESFKHRLCGTKFNFLSFAPIQVPSHHKGTQIAFCAFVLRNVHNHQETSIPEHNARPVEPSDDTLNWKQQIIG